MEDLLNGFLAASEKRLKEIHINKQMGDGIVTTCNIIFSYLMQRCIINGKRYADKEISYIEYDVTNKISEEISTIIDKIVDICNQEVKKNETNI